MFTPFQICRYPPVYELSGSSFFTAMTTFCLGFLISELYEYISTRLEHSTGSGESVMFFIRNKKVWRKGNMLRVNICVVQMCPSSIFSISVLWYTGDGESC